MKKFQIFIIIVVALIAIGVIWHFSKGGLGNKAKANSIKVQEEEWRKLKPTLDEFSRKWDEVTLVLKAKGIIKSEMSDGDKDFSVGSVEVERYPKRKGGLKERNFLKGSEVPTKGKVVRKKSDDF